MSKVKWEDGVGRRCRICGRYSDNLGLCGCQGALDLAEAYRRMGLRPTEKNVSLKENPDHWDDMDSMEKLMKEPASQIQADRRNKLRISGLFQSKCLICGTEMKEGKCPCCGFLKCYNSEFELLMLHLQKKLSQNRG